MAGWSGRVPTTVLRAGAVTARRSGVALPAAVLVGLASVLLCHAALLLAQAELRASSSRVDLALADARVRSAIVGAIADTLPSGARAAAIGASTAIREPWSGGLRLSLRRLGEEVWLIEGRVRVGPADHALALPVWILDPGGRSAGLPIGPAGVTSGPWRLGPMDIASLSARLEEPRLGTLAAPGPVDRRGRCATEVSLNWGDPTGAVAVCRSHRVALRRTGTLRVDGGVGQGLVVVDGDLVLRNTVFDGVLIATGRVTVGAGARVTGWVHGEGGVVVDPAGVVVTSATASVRALEHPALRTPVVVRPVRWLTPPP